MKSAMPYYGISMPELRRIVRRVAREHAPDRADVLELWRGATYREERYAAIELAAASKLTWSDYDEMIVTGAWWDLVDPIATGRLWHLPGARAKLLEYSRDADPWRRRAAIIAQVGRRGDTDWELLQAVIEPNRADRSFWIRKAIGWALREYSKVEPDRVAAYLAGTELSGLSRRVGSAKLRPAPGRTSTRGRSPARG